jgi:glycosyltransferase involved in cell wall biosynthesis
VTPTVSVCIPTYNGEAFIERTLRSVLAQHYKDYEIVLGDDGSTDGTLDVVSRIADDRIRIVPGVSGVNAPANFNRLIAAARGRYVKLLCQDDTLYPDCLGRQVEAMEAGEDRGVVLVSCTRDIVDDHDRVVYRRRGWRNAAGVIEGTRAMRANVRAGTNLIGEPSATLCSRAVLQAVGGYSLAESYMVDLDLWMRMLDRGNLVYLPESLCTFRVSRMSWSSRLARHQAREARQALRSLQATHPSTIRRRDLAVGLLKPTALALARRAVFVLSPVLPSRGIAMPTPDVGSPEVA